jgi:transcriptional regulator with XRE-family HTH domain
MSILIKTCFPQRLKELRKEKGLKQAELADQFKVCKSAVSGWEVGRNQPCYDILIEMSIFFEVTVDYLIGRRNY